MRWEGEERVSRCGWGRGEMLGGGGARQPSDENCWVIEGTKLLSNQCGEEIVKLSRKR